MQLTRDTVLNLLSGAQPRPAKVSQQIRPGEVLDGRIEIDHLIGRGSCGEVYKARQGGVDREVAVKALRPEAAAKKENLDRFFREARVMSALDHPNIARIYALGRNEKGHPYFVLDYLGGRSLADMIADNAIRSEEELISIFDQILSALGHAHGKGVVHRDIKPKNLIVNETDGKLSAHIIDFGIARFVEDHSQSITIAGAVIGSPLYMSPEQCMGKTADARADVYALGCVMHEIVTGAAPHAAEDVTSVIIARLQGVIDEKPQTRFPVSKKCLGLINRALAHDPAERYANADEMLADLRRLQTKERLAARPSRQRIKTFKRSKTFDRLMSVLTGTMMVVVALAVWQFQRYEAKSRQEALARADSLYESAISHRDFHYYSDAEKFFNQAGDLYAKLGTSGARLADLNYEIGQLEMRRGAFSSAMSHFDRALNLAAKYHSSDVMQAQIKFDYGAILAREGRWSQALTMMLGAEHDFYGKVKDECSTTTKHHILNLQRLIYIYNMEHRYDEMNKLLPKLISAQKAYGTGPSHLAETERLYATALHLVGNDQAYVEHLALSERYARAE